MTFRAMNAKYFEPIAQAVMIFGIVALCQPWSLLLHRYGLTITLIGLVGFLVAAHVPPDEDEENEFDIAEAREAEERYGQEPHRPMSERDDPVPLKASE